MRVCDLSGAKYSKLPFPSGGTDGPRVNCRVVLALGCFTHPCRLQSVTVRMVCEKAVDEKRTANNK